MTKNNVPWWFNEGLAETLSAPLTRRQTVLLQEAAADRALYDFDAISPRNLLTNFSPEQLGLAYAQSHVAVLYLQRRYSIRKMATMLESLQNGLEDEDALRDAFGMSYFN